MTYEESIGSRTRYRRRKPEENCKSNSTQKLKKKKLENTRTSNFVSNKSPSFFNAFSNSGSSNKAEEDIESVSQQTEEFLKKLESEEFMTAKHTRKRFTKKKEKVDKRGKKVGQKTMEAFKVLRKKDFRL